jgi:hypothetical protein
MSFGKGLRDLHPQLFAFTPSYREAAKKLMYWGINFYERGHQWRRIARGRRIATLD